MKGAFLMSKRVIILNFQVESQAYQAFSEIKKLHAVRSIKGEQMAVVRAMILMGHMNSELEDFYRLYR